MFQYEQDKDHLSQVSCEWISWNLLMNYVILDIVDLHSSSCDEDLLSIIYYCTKHSTKNWKWTVVRIKMYIFRLLYITFLRKE
jgi:hypothetical protein